MISNESIKVLNEAREILEASQYAIQEYRSFLNKEVELEEMGMPSTAKECLDKFNELFNKLA